MKKKRPESSVGCTMSDASTERHVLPVVFDVVAESLEKAFQDHFTGHNEGVVRATPGGFVLSPQYAAKAEAIYNLPLRADDVWLVSFPKTGEQIAFQ